MALAVPLQSDFEFPATVTPPERPLSPLSFLAAMVRNPITAWPKQVCEERLVVQKVGRQTIVYLTDPELVGAVLAGDQEQFRKNPIERRVFGPLLGEGILTSENERWRWQRRTAAPLFRPAELTDHVPEIGAAAHRVLEKWRRAGPSSVQPIDPPMKRATFEVVTRALLPGDDDVDMAAMERWTSEYLAASSWELVYGLLNLPSWFPHPRKRRALAAARDIRGHLRDLIEKRSRTEGSGTDLLSRLLVAPDPLSGCPMAHRQVLDNVITFLIAGHETTYSTLTWALYLLAHTPEWQTRLSREVFDVCGDAPIRAEQVGKLTLCGQVLKETLRLYPPAPLLSRRAVDRIKIDGQTYASGTMFFVPTYAIHRHRRLWTDPDAFDPSRFDPEQERARHRYTFLPFGAGPRTCIGAAFAMLEATVILATLMQRACFTPAERRPPVPLARITLRPKRTLNLEVTLKQGSGLNEVRVA